MAQKKVNTNQIGLAELSKIQGHDIFWSEAFDAKNEILMYIPNLSRHGDSHTHES